MIATSAASTPKALMRNARLSCMARFNPRMIARRTTMYMKITVLGECPGHGIHNVERYDNPTTAANAAAAHVLPALSTAASAGFKTIVSNMSFMYAPRYQ